MVFATLANRPTRLGRPRFGLADRIARGVWRSGVKQVSIPMKLLTLSCNECGAPLEVPAETKFVTCGYCSARLSVQRTGSAVYTEVLEKIGQQTDRLVQEVETLKLQNELARIDREWSDRREGLMARDKRGNRHVPSVVGSVIVAIIMAVFGIFWTTSAAAAGAPGVFPLFGLIFVLLAIGIGIGGCVKAVNYSEAESEYQRERSGLLSRLQARESSRQASEEEESRR